MFGRALKCFLVSQILLKRIVFLTAEVLPYELEAQEEGTFKSESEAYNSLESADIGSVGNVLGVETEKNQKIRIKKNKGYPWKYKYFSAIKEEQGFDLSPAEMKKFKIWDNGVIPYYIDVVSFSDKIIRDKIQSFLQMVNSVTGVNFIELMSPPADENERWVFFLNRRGLLGCADHSVTSFSSEGVQQVVLGYDCMATKGELAEAVMSILGVPAQHNAPNRDKYIKVNLDNIMLDKKHLFKKLNDDEWLFHDLAYDYDSITHYDMHKYSANGRATLVLKKNIEDFNPAKTFSASDFRKIKLLYTYITGKRNMQAPVCQKLFEIDNNQKRVKNVLRPKKKPIQYLGVSVPDDDKELKERENSKLVDASDNIKGHNDVPEEVINKNEDVAGDANIREIEEEKSDTIGDSKEYTNVDRNKTLLSTKVKKKYKNPLLLLSDFDSHEDLLKSNLNDDTKQEQLKGNVKLDPLSLLSDYQTDNRK